MRVFKVYFELYGKKMKAEINAKDADHAKRRIREKIVFHKVVDITPDNGDDFITNFFNIVNKK